MVEIFYKVYRKDGYMEQIGELRYWLGQLDVDTWEAPLSRGDMLNLYHIQFDNPEDAIAFKIKFGEEWNGNS